jgi:hypothetical protein
MIVDRLAREERRESREETGFSPCSYPPSMSGSSSFTMPTAYGLLHTGK